MARRELVLFALASIRVAGHATDISIPQNLSTKVLLPDVYGYSMEPVWVDDYLKSNITSNLMQAIVNITQKPAPFRIGGKTADQTYLHPDQNVTSIAYPDPTNAETFNITPAWYDTWANYFPPGTDLIYTLNLASNTSDFATAVAEAEAVHAALGSKLILFEYGNEPDLFQSKSWRGPGWGVEEYVAQFANITSQIRSAAWYRNASTPPKIQACTFADLPTFIELQVAQDDFDVVNVTAAGLIDPDLIASYAMHSYPQSTCTPERWLRMRLDLLSNHAVIWTNVSKYVPQIAAANAAGSAFVMGETNSISCSGRSGISDTFGAALWGVDYVLLAASVGIEKLAFHLGAQSEYSFFTPLPYEYKNKSLDAGIRAPFYAHYFISHVIKGDSDWSIAALPAANESDFSGYGVYDASNDALRKLVFVDLGIWNASTGLSNPSTLSATDSTYTSNGTRPVSDMRVTTPWDEGAEVSLLRLNGPGTNAKSDVNVSSVVFDSATGTKIGDEEAESVCVGAGGVVAFELQQAQAVLLELAHV
ncbi:uncharacterized protein J3D65DRAFT_216880 [Phyllosticta citribraziliensis]|uniref:Beta-glucuronidase C-terminal domain-containing protein n=1 Tax=Phyllosticta citribraziliensis TaxID=989973 RepID=A0ABR1M4F8_9PEZI